MLLGRSRYPVPSSVAPWNLAASLLKKNVVNCWQQKQNRLTEVANGFA
jgi:hypothetical protein